MKAILDVLKKVSPEDPLKPLIDNIVNGNIYGIAAIVGCPNPKTRKLFTERMAKELIKLTANLALKGGVKLKNFLLFLFRMSSSGQFLGNEERELIPPLQYRERASKKSKVWLGVVSVGLPRICFAVP